MARGEFDSTIPRTARTYPSPVYSARAGCSAKRTSSVYPARRSASSRTPLARTAIRAAPPRAAASDLPVVMSSGVEGARRPSRCSAMMSTPFIGSPAHEAFVSQHLGESLRLFFHGSRDHLGVAFRGGRRQAANSEGIRECDRVPSDKAEGRRSEFLDRLPGRLHDRGQRRVPRGVCAELDGEKRWQRERVHTLEPTLELARDFELTLSNDDAGDDARMRQTEEPRQQAPGSGIHVIVRLNAGQDEIVGQRADRRRKEPRVLADVERGGIVVCDPDRLVRAFRERLPQHLFRSFRTQGDGDDAASLLLLDPDGLFQRVFVGPVQFVIEGVPPNVLYVRRDLELEVRIRNLFEAHDDVEGHGEREEETDAISSFPSEGDYPNVQAGIPIRRPRQRRCTTWSSQEIGFGLSSNEPASFRAGDWTSLIQSRSNHNPRGTMRPGPPN